jgi:dienelactone hydrolase
MKFLESYVDRIVVPTQFIATGLSLGGHVTWNILAEDPRITAAIIIVGSPNLTNLLLDRLGGYTSTADVPEGTEEWPQSVEKLYQARDKSLTKISGKRILILNGAIDPLVQSKFTRPWIEKYAANNDVTFIEQEENGHWLSYQMMDKIVEWVPQFLI